jgi:hypothetical protein
MNRVSPPPVTVAQFTPLKSTVAAVVNLVEVNAKFPTLVVDFASLSDASLGQLSKTIFAMLVSCVAPLISTEASKAIERKAWCPMVSRLVALLKSTVVTVLQYMNA